MKKIVKYSNCFGFVLALCMMVISGCICSAPKATLPTPDPLAGFHVVSLVYLDNNKKITDDYKTYIQTLSPEEQKFATVDYYYEDGQGQHAVLITVGINHTNWRHVLIYDKDNKRVKTIKYADGNSMS
jgi:hypothetical protein